MGIREKIPFCSFFDNFILAPMNTSAIIMMFLSVGTVTFFTVRYFWLALKTPTKEQAASAIPPENSPL